MEGRGGRDRKPNSVGREGGEVETENLITKHLFPIRFNCSFFQNIVLLK